jgi:hypothetical protein
VGGSCHRVVNLDLTIPTCVLVLLCFYERQKNRKCGINSTKRNGRSTSGPPHSSTQLGDHSQERHRISQRYLICSVDGDDSDSSVAGRQRAGSLLRSRHFVHRKQTFWVSCFHGFHRSLQASPGTTEHSRVCSSALSCLLIEVGNLRKTSLS